MTLDFENFFFNTSPTKPKINYYYEYFNHTNELRKKEIDDTLAFNCEQSSGINKYIVCHNQYLSECIKIIEHIKNVTIIEHNERCTFQYIFDLSNKITTDSDINITSNNDILLDKIFFETIYIEYKYFYWLSRYEKINDKYPINYKNGGSADTWVWRGKNKIKKANFYYGLLGCDNEIGFLARKNGYIVKNPSYTYKTFHNHKSQYRTDSKNRFLRVCDAHKFKLKPHQ